MKPAFSWSMLYGPESWMRCDDVLRPDTRYPAGREMRSTLMSYPISFTGNRVIYGRIVRPGLVVGILATIAVIGALRSWPTPGVSILIVASEFMVMAYLAISDIKARTIPNRVVIPAIFAVIAVSPWSAHWQSHGFLHPVLMSVAGCLFCVTWMGLAANLSQGRLAGGDIKLAGLIGAMTAMPFAPAALGIGVLIAGGYACFLMGSGSRGLHGVMPYTPGLCAACCILVAYLWFGTTNG